MIFKQYGQNIEYKSIIRWKLPVLLHSNILQVVTFSYRTYTCWGCSSRPYAFRRSFFPPLPPLLFPPDVFSRSPNSYQMYRIHRWFIHQAHFVYILLKQWRRADTRRSDTVHLRKKFGSIPKWITLEGREKSLVQLGKCNLTTILGIVLILDIKTNSNPISRIFCLNVNPTRCPHVLNLYSCSSDFNKIFFLKNKLSKMTGW